jgi:hypothetical protein
LRAATGDGWMVSRSSYRLTMAAQSVDSAAVAVA